MHLYIITFLVGCVAALAELLSRYDRIGQIFSFFSSWIYFLINGFAAILAYWFITEYNLDFGALTETEIGKIIVSGTSSMVILRSSFASIKNGNQSIEAGFAAITNVFLKNADRTFDRKRSIDDYKEIHDIMKDIDFNKAKLDLPLICLGMMKNVTLEEQQVLANDILKLSHESYSPKAKAINLGVLVSATTGLKLLEEVINSNKDIFANVADGAENEKALKINELLNKLK
jgi:hypothetical protein